MTIANYWVTGCYELGTVLDGTCKKFPADSASATAPAASSAAPNPMAASSTSPSPTASSKAAWAMRSRSVDGALLEDITITNTTMRDLASAPLFFRLGAAARSQRIHARLEPSSASLVNNLGCYNAPTSGLDPERHSRLPVEDLKFSDIYIETGGGGTAEDAKAMPTEQEDNYPDPGRFGVTPSTGLFLRHIRNLEMSHVASQPYGGRASTFILGTIDRADLFALTGPRSADGAVMLSDVKDLRIGWSRAAADTVMASVDSKTL